MFARVNKSGNDQYVQVVTTNVSTNTSTDASANGSSPRSAAWTCSKSRATSTAWFESVARFSAHLTVLNALKTGHLAPSKTVHVGPPLVFQRLWEELGLPDILQRLLSGRKFQFPLERLVFITVLHRLFAPGSDPGQRSSGRTLVPQLRFGRYRPSRPATLLPHDGLAGRGCFSHR